MALHLFIRLSRNGSGAWAANFSEIKWHHVSMRDHQNKKTSRISEKLPYHNRYPYSGKIYCEEHGTTFHRQVLESRKGTREVWQCKVYRAKDRAACAAPQIQSKDLDQINRDYFPSTPQNEAMRKYLHGRGDLSYPNDIWLGIQDMIAIDFSFAEVIQCCETEGLVFNKEHFL